MKRKYLSTIVTLLLMVLLISATAYAAPVGRFLKIEGQVDLLKGGKLPAAAARVTEPVELKDVIRTKSNSRAQVLFVDDTILTLAPESRVAVADYFYDGAQGQRRTLIQVFQGLAHTVVKQALQIQEPNFIMRTQTVVIGVRGTEWYTLIRPNSTNVYNIHGLLELTSSNRLIPGSLLLPALKYSEVHRDRPPGPARDLTPELLTILRRMMDRGPGEPLPDISGGPGPFPEVDRLRVPEAVTPPYAPQLSPVAPQRTPGTPGTQR